MVLLGDAVTGEPAWTLMPVDLFKHGAGILQPIIERARFNRPSGKAVEMRKGDLVAQAVILLGLDHLPVLGGIVAEAARIELAHRDVG